MSDEDGEQALEAIHKQVGGWFDDFIKSPQYEPLTEVQRNEAPGIVVLLRSACVAPKGGTPAGFRQFGVAGRVKLLGSGNW